TSRLRAHGTRHNVAKSCRYARPITGTPVLPLARVTTGLPSSFCLITHKSSSTCRSMILGQSRMRYRGATWLQSLWRLFQQLTDSHYRILDTSRVSEN